MSRVRRRREADEPTWLDDAIRDDRAGSVNARINISSKAFLRPDEFTTERVAA